MTEAGEAAPATPAAPKLPPIADKADDLEAIKTAVDDAAAVGGGLWLSYLFVLFYLAVAAGAVTHEDLFFERSVKLPFLNIELPLLAFFFLAPILFIIAHAYTLVHLVMLTDKAKRFHQALYAQIGYEDGLSQVESARRTTIRAALRRQLPSNIFVQFLAGPTDVREGLFGWLLRTIAWSTLVVAPVLLLLLMQIQFLPFHSSLITWTHRIVLLADLGLMWWLWRKILSGREFGGGRWRASWAWTGFGLALSLAVLLFSVTVVTFPGEWQEEHVSKWRFAIVSHASEHANDKPSEPQRISLTDWSATLRDWAASSGNWVLTREASLHDALFNAQSDKITRRRLPFSNTLVLPALNIYEGLGIDDPDKAKWHDFVFRARGRDLRGAIFALATLPKVDLEGAELQGASLDGAQLQGASLETAQLQGATLVLARLQGASLHGAQLQGATLFGAQLQGARLTGARLQGASLDGAQLQGVSLENAQLQGATLGGAQLQGALLDGAQLQGATLDQAYLQGAALDEAQLQGASLQDAILEATDLSDAYLWRTNRPKPPSTVAAIRVSGESWLPEWMDDDRKKQPWDDKAYQELRTTLDSLPPGRLRDYALGLIRSLDCSSPDKTLASCNPSAAPPPEAATWRSTLEAASVDDETYANALAKTLKELVCSGSADAIYVVRGDGFQCRLRDAGSEAIKLIDDLTSKDSKDCPVAAALTDANLSTKKQVFCPARATRKSATSETPYSP